MKKVLMVGPVPPPEGGIASMMQDILHSELSQEYAFDAFAGPFTYPPGVADPIRKNIARAMKYLGFYKRCKKVGYCFIHIHSPSHHFLGNAVYMLLAGLAGTKVLLHLHGNDWNFFYVNASLFKRRLLRAGLRLASRIIVLQRVWQEQIEGLQVPARVSVIPNMAPPRITPDPILLQETRKWAGLEPDDFLVLMVGAGIMGRDKGFFDLVKAVPLIIREEESVRFVLAGAEEQPGQMAKAKEIVAGENLDRWIRLVGNIDRERVYLLMEIASVFLLPSYIEGMPIGIIEAMRSGTVVIATPVGAIPDMIADGISGMLIPVEDPHAIARAVIELKQDDRFRQDLAKGAERVFAERFDLSSGVAMLRGIYKEMEEMGRQGTAIR